MNVIGCTLLLLVTGYTAPSGAHTASGTVPTIGEAACPRWLPFGTAVQIDGVGLVTCQDRYAVGLSDRFDVFVSTPADAYALTGVYPWRPA